jgi:hypothetical protein
VPGHNLLPFAASSIVYTRIETDILVEDALLLGCKAVFLRKFRTLLGGKILLRFKNIIAI